MKVLLSLKEEFDGVAGERSYSIAGASVFARSEPPKSAGDPSAMRVFQAISDAAAVATQHFTVERYGEAALAQFVAWLEAYAADSLFQRRCLRCGKILAEDSLLGFLPPTVRTFQSGAAYHPVCLAHAAMQKEVVQSGEATDWLQLYDI